MKHIFLTTVAILLANLLFGQVPQAFNYQGAARTAAGAPIANSTIAIRASVLDGSAAGTVVYSERNVTTTSGSGIFSIGIGNGTPLSGTFNSIDWSTGNKFLKIDLDATGGTNYVTLGTTQFLSVPYAQYAGSAGQVSVANKTITGIIRANDENGQTLSNLSGFTIGLIGSEPAMTTITDADGTFKFTEVQAGEYLYSITKTGFDSDRSNGFSIVSGGLKQVVRNPVFELSGENKVQELSTIVFQNLSVTSSVGSNFYGSGADGQYNFLNFRFQVSSSKNPIPSFYPIVYFGTSPGFQVNSNGDSPSLAPTFGDYGAFFNNDLQNPQIDFLASNSKLVPGTRYYFKVYSPRSGGQINLINGSNEVSYIMPNKSSVKIQNLAVTTLTSTNIDGINSINFSGTVNGTSGDGTELDVLIYYNDSPGVTINNSYISTRLSAGSPLNFNYSVSEGLFSPGSRVYFKAFHSFNDGSGVNQTSASNEVSIIVPPVSSIKVLSLTATTSTSAINGRKLINLTGVSSQSVNVNDAGPGLNFVIFYSLNPGVTANMGYVGAYPIQLSDGNTFTYEVDTEAAFYPPGTRLYYKAFHVFTNGDFNEANASDEVSVVIPSPTSINLSGFAVTTGTSLENGENYLTFSGNVSATQTNGVRIYYGSTSDFTPSGLDYYIETSNNSGTFSVNQVVNGSNLTPGATVYFKAFSIDPSGSTDFNSGSNSFSIRIPPTITLTIGVNYQGGKVAYIFQVGDPGYIAGETHGLIVSPTNLTGASGIQWFNGPSATGASDTRLGSGSLNTSKIIAVQSNSISYAAKLCDDLVLDGYSDWYLPSLNELEKYFLNFSYPWFTNGSYWSSTEGAIANAYVVEGVPSVFYSTTKSSYHDVRAFRSF